MNIHVNPKSDLKLVTEDGAAIAQDLVGEGAPLAVRGMTVSYGDKPAVFSVDATFEEGSLTAIIGPNGAGKSTLLKAVLGIVPKVSGEVTVFGQPVMKSLERIAYVPQRSSVDWDFPTTVIDVVLMGLYKKLGLLGRLRGDHRRQAIDVLDQLGMADFADRQIGKLSGGQQQRVFIARALAQNADLYLLDEPFAGVDAATEKTIMAVLNALKEQGKTIAVVHHDLATVSDYFDRALLLNVRKVAEGTVADVFTRENLHATYGGKLMATHVDLLPAVSA